MRRRAALAVGRVGLRDGADALVRTLSDADPEVRQMAAYALGLLGDERGRDALVTALADRAKEDGELSLTLGIAYLQAGDAVKAEDSLRRATTRARPT